MSANDKAYSGSIPKVYETFLVPMIFTDYAADMARRVAARLALGGSAGPPQRVLEIAAGTGVVTRAMIAALPASVGIVATDLNPDMTEQARQIGTARTVDWQQADAQQLPFPDQSFDAVVIQFGVMFFPDRPKALGEARRVLRPGGALLFAVWDRIDDNDFAAATEAGLAKFFPDDPPRFLSRAPYGYFDRPRIAADVAAGGFTVTPHIDTVTARSRARLPSDPAVGYCQGTPLMGEIDSRGSLEQATDAVAKEIEERFGPGPLDTKIQALVVTVEK